MNNDELIAAHHLDQVRRGLMPNSIDKRDESLRSFARTLGRRSLLRVTREDVDEFLDGRLNAQGEPIANRTRYCWISHLHSFYEWARREELTKLDPTAKIIRPKLRRTLPRPASTAKLAKALEHAGPLHRCWVLLAALEGLRCQEIAGMRREDVLDVEGLLRVTKAKGGKERLIPLMPDVLESLLALPMPQKGWVFIRPMGGPYKAANVSHEFNEFLRREGVGATAHQLRHWFGSNLYAQSHDIRLTQEMLGHSNLATTAIYTAFDSKAAGVAMRAMTFDGPEAA